MTRDRDTINYHNNHQFRLPCTAFAKPRDHMPAETSRSADAAAASAAAIQTAAVTQRALATCCPRCGAGVPSANSDFCEQCAAHLYPGYCVFCLEPLAPNQAFCRYCGLPPEGVTCGACGTFSRFDFCPNPDCGAGLTPRAAAELTRLETDPDASEAFAELDEIDAVLSAMETAEPSTNAGNAPAPRSSDTEPLAENAPATPILQAPASAAVVAEIAAVPTLTATRPRSNLAALRAAAQGASTAEEKARVRQLAEQAANDALNAVASRRYPSAQEARAAGTALQVALRYRAVSEKLEVVAWRCNAFNCVHNMPGGMSSCSDPSQGGVPITQMISTVQDASTEFSV